MMCPGGPVEGVRMGLVSFLSPVQKLWTRSFSRSSAQGTALGQSTKTHERVRALENQVLRQQERIKQLSHQLALMRSVRRQLPQLAGQAVPAEVIGQDTSMLRRSVLVDAGVSDGVYEDSAVLVDGGLVGRVTAAGRRASRVMLLSDPGSCVPVLATRTREQGILAGNLDDRETLEVEFASRFANLRTGDLIVTSGVGGVFPKGIVVGRVVTAVARPGELFKTVRIKPGVDLFRLERVVVLKRLASARLYPPDRPE